MHDNFSTDALNDQNLGPRTVHITDHSSNESSSSETQEYSQKFTPPSSTANSSSNDLPRNPKPPSSLLVKFAKRVAICTAVVALARFSYPYLLKLVEEPEIAVAEDGLYHLGEKSFDLHIKKGSHLIKFYAPWCGHCKKMSPAWDELAKDVDEDKSVSSTIAKVDCTKHQSICQDQGVSGYPTIMFFRDGAKVETYRGGRTFRELKDYVVSMKSDKDEAASEGEAEVAKVAVLDAKNFEDSIKTGVTFVKFFAPWCGHCKRLAPTWEELAAKYADDEGVSIAKVDCTAEGNTNKELCDGQDVKGFPTLNIYKDGKKITEYNGKRGLEELEKFVKEHSGAAKDEL